MQEGWLSRGEKLQVKAKPTVGGGVQGIISVAWWVSDEGAVVWG